MKKNNLPWNEWYAKAEACKNPDDFQKLHDELFVYNKCEHTYDSAVHAVSALAIAGAWIGTRVEGLTGFQAGHIKFDFIHEYDHIGKDVGVEVVDYDKLLYPQYLSQFPLKRIRIETWKRVQYICAQKLNRLDTDEVTMYGDYRYVEHHSACWAVRQYWGDVCNGIIPPAIVVLYENSDVRVSAISPIAVERPAHTLADLEDAWKDHTSPYYDKARYEEYMNRDKDPKDAPC